MTVYKEIDLSLMTFQRLRYSPFLSTAERSLSTLGEMGSCLGRSDPEPYGDGTFGSVTWLGSKGNNFNGRMET